MTHSEQRACIGCGYPVTHHVINDAHDPYPVEQFVAVMRGGAWTGLAAVTDYCPQCGGELTLLSTHPRQQQDT